MGSGGRSRRRACRARDAAPLYAFSSKLGWLVFISVVRGAGFASLTVLCGMLIARISAPENHREAVGIYGLSVALPNLAAVPAGVALTSSGHFAWVAWLAVSPVLGLPVLRRLQAALGPDTPRHERRTVGSIRRAVRASLGPSVVLAAVTAAGGGVVTFLPLDRPHGAVAPLALLVVGVSVALSRWRAAAWWHRTGPQLLICALTGAAAGLTMIAAALHRWPGTGSATVIVVGAGVFGMGYGVTQNLTLVAAFDRARTEHAITASMVWNVAFDAGTAVGAYGVGAVADTGIGLPWTYLVTAGLVALSIPIAARTCSPVDHPARWSA